MSINVLIVDSTALVRVSLPRAIEAPDIIVVAAVSAPQAISEAKRLRPHVIIVDSTDAGFSGPDMIRQLMAHAPAPIIALSGRTPDDAQRVMRAIEAGAVDFIIKPDDFTVIDEEIIAKIRSVAQAHPITFGQAMVPRKQHYAFAPTGRKVIVIGVSTGGPQTLERLLPEIPRNIPAPILIVQHMPPLFTRSLAEHLDMICEVEVKEAQEGDIIKEGTAYIAPGGFHMEVAMRGEDAVITLNTEPAEQGVRPCADRLFRSAAAAFGYRTIGLVLTGMGRDGTDGAKAIKAQGGTIITEAAESCIIYGMPKEAAVYADAVVPLEKIAVALLQLVDT